MPILNHLPCAFNHLVYGTQRNILCENLLYVEIDYSTAIILPIPHPDLEIRSRIRHINIPLKRRTHMFHDGQTLLLRPKPYIVNRRDKYLSRFFVLTVHETECIWSLPNIVLIDTSFLQALFNKRVNLSWRQIVSIRLPIFLIEVNCHPSYTAIQENIFASSFIYFLSDLTIGILFALKEEIIRIIPAGLDDWRLLLAEHFDVDIHLPHPAILIRVRLMPALRRLLPNLRQRVVFLRGRCGADKCEQQRKQHRDFRFHACASLFHLIPRDETLVASIAAAI